MTHEDRKFLLDANIFIQAKNSYYAFTICPGFWDSLLAYHKMGKICSIDHIKHELLLGSDELADWSKQKRLASFFHSTQDIEVVAQYRGIMEWVQRNDQFFDLAKADFAASADGWLIAYAKVNKHVVVTHEQFAPNVKNKVPIPNICEEFNVDYTDTFQMLKTLKIRFVREQ